MDSSKSETTEVIAPSARVLLDSAAEKLPTPDGVAVAIMEAWENDEVTAKQMAHLVQTDPALTGRVLKLANSASTGLRSVASVPDAIVRIGMKTVGQLAIAFSLIANDDDGACAEFNRQAFWSRCLLMAIIARALGAETRLAPPEDLFAAGLLGRIGMLALACVYPHDYARILRSGTDNLTAKEKEVFGVDHNELSELMMLDFFVPRALAEPARYAEDPEMSGFDVNSRPQKITILLHLAFRLSGAAEDKGVLGQEVMEAFAAQLGLASGRIGQMFDQALAEWKEWSELLNLPACELDPYEDQVDQATDEQGAANPPPEEMASLAVAVKLNGNKLDAVLDNLQAAGAAAFASDKPSELIRLTMERRARVLFCHFEDLQLVRNLRGTESADGIQVFVVIDQTNPETKSICYDAGADHVIPDDMDQLDLERRLRPAVRLLRCHERWNSDRKELARIAKELAISHRQQQVLALTDQLTGLPNRRAAMDFLNKAWSASTRRELPCAIQIIDIDHFKSVNDRFGHAAGDQVLRSVSEVLQSAVRRDEAIARIGGEEFLLISNRMDAREAIVAAERLRRCIGEALIDVGGEQLAVSASVGVALREKGIDSSEDLMRAADKALYAAKESGRNRLCLFTGGQVRFLKTAAGQ